MYVPHNFGIPPTGDPRFLPCTIMNLCYLRVARSFTSGLDPKGIGISTCSEHSARRVLHLAFSCIRLVEVEVVGKFAASL